MRNGDYLVTYGDNLESSRKLTILIDGVVSINVPVHPNQMLQIVREMLGEGKNSSMMTYENDESQRSPPNLFE